MNKKEALEVLMRELSKNNEHMFRLKLMAIYLQEYEVAAKIKAIDTNKLKDGINESLNKNKKAYFEYQILEKYTAGIKLQGSEVKSIRNGKISIGEAYCFIANNEVFIKGMHISEHKEGGKHNNHQPIRDRKLLLNKKEIIKLDEKSSQKGLTIVPLEVILTDTGFIKVEIGLAKGKNLYDKRQTLKEKDLKREIERNL